MGRVFHRIISVFLTAVFILSAVVTGTYSWYSLQSVTCACPQANIILKRTHRRRRLPSIRRTVNRSRGIPLS